MMGVEQLFHQQAPIQGIDVEIVTRLARELGVAVETVPCNWVRCLKMMEHGEVDLLSSVFRNEEREEYMSFFAQPYLSGLAIAFYQRKGSPAIVDYSDLGTEKRIGVLHGAEYFPRFDHDSTLVKIHVPTQDVLYPMLAKGHIDAFVGYVSTENYFLATGKFSGIVKSKFEQPGKIPVYLALSRKSPFLKYREKLNAIQETLLKRGIVDSIVASTYKRYELPD